MSTGPSALLAEGQSDSMGSKTLGLVPQSLRISAGARPAKLKSFHNTGTCAALSAYYIRGTGFLLVEDVPKWVIKGES
jgi:hypothetical protein